MVNRLVEGTTVGEGGALLIGSKQHLWLLAASCFQGLSKGCLTVGMYQVLVGSQAGEVGGGNGFVAILPHPQAAPPDVAPEGV